MLHNRNKSCADPGTFLRGGPGQSDKKSSDVVFFFCFFCPQLILQKSNGQFQNLSFFKVSEGVQHFPGGSNFFQGGGGGSNCLFPIETHITCDFPGGSGPPVPPPPSRSALASNVMTTSDTTMQIFIEINKL